MAALRRNFLPLKRTLDINPESAVEYLDNLDTASQWGHGRLAQATKLPLKPMRALCELPASRVPIGGLFQAPQSHPFLGVNVLRLYWLVSSSQLPLLGARVYANQDGRDIAPHSQQFFPSRSNFCLSAEIDIAWDSNRNHFCIWCRRSNKLHHRAYYAPLLSPNQCPFHTRGLSRLLSLSWFVLEFRALR